MGQFTAMTITPDLETRESVMLAAGRTQFAVTRKEDDQTMYVRFDCKRKNPEGSDKRYSQVPLDEATHVFISEKGYGTPRLGTYYPPREGYTDGRFFPADGVSPDHPHLSALAEVVRYVNSIGFTSVDYGIEAESNCGMCGRELTDPVSIQRGIGPECAAKPTGTRILHASAFAQQKLDTEDQVQDAMAGDITRQPSQVADGCGGWVESDSHGDFGDISEDQSPEEIASQVENVHRVAEKQFATVEASRERIAHMEGDRAELRQQRMVIDKRVREISLDISREEGHLAELLEAAQS